MAYDILVVSAHPDDAEVQMGGTLAALTDQGQRALLVDLCDGEPSDFAEPGVLVSSARLPGHQCCGAFPMRLQLC